MIEKLSKKDVMAELSIRLRARGYRKKGAYWYKDYPTGMIGVKASRRTRA